MNHNIDIEHNKQLIKKYPFLLPHSRWTGEVPSDYDYSYTELDDMPDGWRKAFGEQMCDEIEKELEKHNLQEKYRIAQIKEKYGTLRWYDFGATEKILKEIIPKYEKLSAHTCINCGKPATKVTLGWISPYCDDCCPKRGRSVPVEDYFSEAKSFNVTYDSIVED